MAATSQQQGSRSVAPCGLFKPTGENQDMAWQWNSLKDLKDRKSVTCDYCLKTTTGGITRAKRHQMGIRGDVGACKKTPPDVRKLLKEAHEKKQMEKDALNEELQEDQDELDEVQEIMNIRSGKRPLGSSSLPASKKSNNVKGPMDRLLYRNPETTIKLAKRQTSINDACDKEARARTVQYIERFLCTNGLAFNVVKSRSFKLMVEAIGNYGPHLKVPTYYECRVPLLKKELEYTKGLLRSHEEERAMYGCSIMSDAWTDRRSRTLINFLVHCPKGSSFVRSVDGSGYMKTGEKIFQLLDQFVVEIGEQHVVQVISDNGSNYVMAGKLLETRRKHLFWTPCAAHCIDLMLEDIGKIAKVKKAIERGISLVGFIYNHALALSMMRKFTSKMELVRHGVTRFATSFLTVQRLHSQKNNIRRMITSDEWLKSNFAKDRKAKRVTDIVLMPSFWNDVVYTLKAMGPLVKVLRLVDHEKKPAMGYIYEAMDRAKETIIASFLGNEARYNEIFDIIDRRWQCQLHHPLHAAGHFLNPEYFYKNPRIDLDHEVMSGLHKCIERLSENAEIVDKITSELSVYKRAEDLFGLQAAIRQRTTLAPAEWWKNYGSQTPNLQLLAIKVLSLTCSSSGCERNWSVFEHVGDPLEKAALKGIDWSYRSDEKAVPKRGNGNPVQIVQRYHFASYLKRMAVIVRIQEEFFAFVKGAPEIIQDRLINIPPSYVETYKKYTRQGSRVLALAYKSLSDMTVSEARSLDRDIVESGLTFAGFVVFNCPIRSDSATVLSELKGSSHDLVMITGDQALTACHVASQVNIISKPTLILSPASNGEGYNWVSPDETENIRYSEKEVEYLSETHDLCVGGDCIEMLQQTSANLLVIPHVKVFARVAPEQKELIMTTYKTVGRVTLMCGDGTNDVGALKQAHVGVALLNALPPTQSGNSSSDSSVKQKKSRPALETSGKTVSSIGEGTSKAKVASKSDSTSHSSVNRHQTAVDMQRQKLKKMMDELNEEGDGRAPIVKLGDASMASPFTAKHASVAPTTDIIRQGRSTLVTTLQMFKILGLNCLATAYVLSVMYLDGVKLGDVQATISGVFTAAFFLFISHARPLPTLSAERPHPNIFCAYVLLSLLGQFSIHLFFLISSVREAEKYMPDECIEPDADFHPNLVNTVSYMVNMMLQVATFAVNYMGHPFNQSISENKPFLYALVAAVGFFTVITSDIFRDLNDWLKLVPLPVGLRDKLLLWAFLMFLVCYSWERLLRWAFPGKIPAWKKRQRVAVSNLEKKKQL